MSENQEVDGGNDTSQGSGETGGSGSHADEALRPSRAWELHEEHGLSYREIGAMYDVSKDTARRRVKAFEEGRSRGVQEVTDNPEAYDLSSTVSDPEPQDNPYDETSECPACGELIPTPESAGDHPCPECDTVLGWTQAEVGG